MNHTPTDVCVEHIPTPQVQWDNNCLVGPMGQFYAYVADASPAFRERVAVALNSHDALVAALQKITNIWNENIVHNGGDAKLMFLAAQQALTELK